LNSLEAPAISFSPTEFIKVNNADLSYAINVIVDTSFNVGYAPNLSTQGFLNVCRSSLKSDSKPPPQDTLILSRTGSAPWNYNLMAPTKEAVINMYSGAPLNVKTAVAMAATDAYTRPKAVDPGASLMPLTQPTVSRAITEMTKMSPQQFVSQLAPQVAQHVAPVVASAPHAPAKSSSSPIMDFLGNALKTAAPVVGNLASQFIQQKYLGGTRPNFSQPSAIPSRSVLPSIDEPPSSMGSSWGALEAEEVAPLAIMA